MKNTNMKKALVASALAVALVSVGLASGCAAHTETYTGVQTPGIMTQPVEDTLKAAAEKAAAEKTEKALAAQREAAKKAAEEAKAAADEAALDGGEIVEDANAPEGTVAVKAADGTTRYINADKAQASVDSGKTAPKKSESASNGGSSNSGSSNAASSGNSGSSNKGNSGSSNSGSSSSSNGGSNSGSASKPAPAPEPEPAPAPEPEPGPSKDPEDETGMHDSSHNAGDCLDCGYHANGHYTSCPSCGSSEWMNYWE